MLRRVWTTREISAPADVVWRLLIDVDAWPAWGPSVRRAELETSSFGLGARGRVQTAVGAWLPFEVTRFDEGRSWAWRVAGLDATHHVVEPLGEARCRAGFGVAWSAAPYLGICAVALRRIELLAVGGSG